MTIRSPVRHQRGNRLLLYDLRVANVWTADPGTQVENVPARGRRARYQRVLGSLWPPGGAFPRRFSPVPGPDATAAFLSALERRS